MNTRTSSDSTSRLIVEDMLERHNAMHPSHQLIAIGQAMHEERLRTAEKDRLIRSLRLERTPRLIALRQFVGRQLIRSGNALAGADGGIPYELKASSYKPQAVLDA